MQFVLLNDSSVSEGSSNKNITNNVNPSPEVNYYTELLNMTLQSSLNKNFSFCEILEDVNVTNLICKVMDDPNNALYLILNESENEILLESLPYLLPYY